MTPCFLMGPVGRSVVVPPLGAEARDAAYSHLMKSVPEEWECLRLAAKAADRMAVAEALRPEFERRLAELGYSSLAIAHAFSLLSGRGRWRKRSRSFGAAGGDRLALRRGCRVALPPAKSPRHGLGQFEVGITHDTVRAWR